VTTLETHVHADHITAAWLLKMSLGSMIALSADAGASGADRYLKGGDRVTFGKRHLEVRATPGHTGGCLTFVLDDQSMAFTGDALLVRGCGRTDFQEGNAARLFRSVHEQIFTLPDNCAIYPGHDYTGATSSSVGEERAFNPRLGSGIGEADFRGFMDNLGLAHPKKIDEAVPANLHCGRLDVQAAPDVDWAPVYLTYAGVPEIGPAWVEENGRGIQIIDVREPHEFNNELGHVPGAKLIPLGELGRRLGEIDQAVPVVVVCRSGARSARATLGMKQAGFSRVANMTGGMLNWNAMGLAVE
jgi:rhodanese-related sulfurtransferase